MCRALASTCRIRSRVTPKIRPTSSSVAELSDSVLSITGTACEVLITLDGVSYDYHGSQDIPSAIQKSPGGPFVSVLELMLRNGDTFVMAEVRTASSPGDQQH